MTAMIGVDALQGAIGMTYETDGGGNLAFRRDDETVVTMRDGMSRHFTASMRSATKTGKPVRAEWSLRPSRNSRWSTPSIARSIRS